MPLLEQNIGGLWVAKQSAKGTVASTPVKKLRWAGGDVSPAREDGSENWVSSDRFGTYADYVDSLSGVGDPQIPALPNDLAYLCYLFFGAETVTGASDPYTHTFAPQAAGGFWSTWWKSLGSSVIQRQRFADMRIGQLTIEGSTGSKIVKATPTLLGLDPAEVIASDPATAVTSQNPFLYTEGESTFTIDGSVFRGQSQFQVTWNENLSLVYGDSVSPYDLAMGQPSISITVSIPLDSAGLQRYNNLVYGSASPSAGTKPTKFLPALGSYGFTLAQKNASGPVTPAREFTLNLAAVKWTPDVAIPANPAGGTAEIQLTGESRFSSAVTIKNSDVAYT